MTARREYRMHPEQCAPRCAQCNGDVAIGGGYRADGCEGARGAGERGEKALFMRLSLLHARVHVGLRLR